jgi:protein JSN1
LPFGIAKGFKDEGLLNALNSRPRATTIGISEGQRRQGARGSAFQPRVGGDASGGFIDRSRSDKEFAGMHRAIAPRHNLSSSISSRTSTPDEAGGRRDQSGATQGQVPTRSLWLGNLDVTTTAQELMQFFSPYGAIESLRLLPEKVSKSAADLRIPMSL